MSIWPSVKLSECCEIVGGATPSTSDPSHWGGDVHWATPKDLSDLDGSYLDATPRTLTQSGLSSCSASILPPRSVLFSSRAPIGLVAINRVPVATNQGFKSFVPDTSRVHAEYLLHWLRTHRPMLESLGNGATFKEVSKAVVSRVEMPLPPVADQRRIAEVLDRAETLRAQRRQALAQLDALAESIFLEMFGDPTFNSRGLLEKPLAALIRSGDTINYGVVQPGNEVAQGVPLVRVGDLLDGRVDQRSLKRIAPAIEAGYKRSRLRGDEILVSCVGTVGVVVVADPSLKGYNIARAVARVPLSEMIDRAFPPASE